MARSVASICLLKTIHSASTNSNQAIKANQTQPKNQGNCTNNKGVSNGVLAREEFFIVVSITGQHFTATKAMTDDNVKSAIKSDPDVREF